MHINTRLANYFVTLCSYQFIPVILCYLCIMGTNDKHVKQNDFMTSHQNKSFCAITRQ